MKHINKVAETLQVSLDVVRTCCRLLDLALQPNDTLDETIEQQLVQLKEIASREGMSLEEAAQHLIAMRDRKSEVGEHKFDKREYIKQRFGVDPEQASSDSFVGILYRDADRGIQLGELRHKVVLESSTLALEEFVFHGSSSLAEGNTSVAAGYNQAQERINSRIDNDFFGKVNWGEDSSSVGRYIDTAAETVEVLAAENRAISEEIVAQMLPICYRIRDESLLNLRKTSTQAVGINLLSVVAGTVVGTWVAVPPTQERQEIPSIQPILIGVGIGELVGLILSLVIIWFTRDEQKT